MTERGREWPMVTSLTDRDVRRTLLWQSGNKTMEHWPTGNSFSYSPPPILIIDHNPQVITSLPQCFFNSPEMTFDACSRQQAEKQLRLRQYRAVVSDIHLAALDDFSLLELNQQAQAASSLIVTAGPGDEHLILEALERGSLDFLALPLDSKQVSSTIERAVWIHQMRTTIRRREETLLTFRQQRDRLSLATEHDKKVAAVRDKTMMSFERTIRACETTIAAVERSLGYLRRTEESLKYKAHMRARLRLGVMNPKV